MSVASLLIRQLICFVKARQSLPSFFTLERTAQTAIDALSSHIAGLSSTGTNSQFYHSLRAWIALLCAKMTMTVRADHHAGIRWTKRALGMLSHHKMGVTSQSSGGVTSVSLDACVPRLEAVLLVADLFEQAGHIESRLTYTSEAVSIAKVKPSSCQQYRSSPFITYMVPCWLTTPHILRF